MAPIFTRLSNAFGFGASSGEVQTPNPATGTYATGGTVTYAGGNRIHTFTASGSFIVKNSNLTSADYVLAAGGGGGAGGLVGTVPQFPAPIRMTALSFSGTEESPQTLTVTIGAGGAASPPTGGQGGEGDNSIYSGVPITCTGGGTGGAPQTGNPQNAGKAGGSGGGGSAQDAGGPGSFGGGGGDPGQGKPGGGGYHVGSIYIYGGGGGGAGQAGQAAPGSGSPAVDNRSGAGGNGRELEITGSAVWFAGGGSGGTQPGPTDVTAGHAGSGGGGAGLPGSTSPITSNGGAGLNAGESRDKDDTTGGDGGDNTGGGGGGGNNAGGRYQSGAGGSGVMIISYPAPSI